MKKLPQYLGAATLALGVSACSVPRTTSHVESFQLDTDKRVSLLVNVQNSSQAAVCNYARIRIENSIQRVTAKHCLTEEHNNLGRDIVFGEYLTSIVQELGGSGKVIPLPGAPEPTPLEVSPLSPVELDGQPITVVGCLPEVDRGNVWCYTIRSTASHTRDNAIAILLSPEDYERIAGHSTNFTFQGMSGSPALDAQGRFIGVASLAANVRLAGWLEIEPIHNVL